MRRTMVALLGATAAAVLLPASAAFASAQHSSAAGLTFDIGPSPAGLPSNCPFGNGDANFVFLNGNTVSHDTTNANGDWGGDTAEGTAVFYEGTVALYQGHLTIWNGGGNNAKAQSESGLTLDFSGTGAGGRLTIHANAHGTTNAAGTPTSNVLNVNISCS
ncbi:MAG: hypothetical protein JWO62_2008 [Acidimicrobiaceae bacterium]|jgi:hypothetical protein|nr:hypothetical protein [Acidimicrobiaceae bacterium]